ncbi:unnamed protein product [Urochloa humidicola]
MARTKRTARKSTGGRRVRFAPTQPAPPAPPAEVEPEEVLVLVEMEDGNNQVMAQDALLVALSAPHVPVPPAPTVEEAPQPPVAPASPAAAVGGDPEDPGDDSDDDEDDDDDDDDNDNDQNDEGDNQDDGPQERSMTYEVYTSDNEQGYFPRLLEDMLRELGCTVRPCYVIQRFTDPPLDDNYLTRVHIRERRETSGGFRTNSMHDSTVPLGTYAASVSEAARRALSALCYAHRLELSVTEYRHLPRRPSGGEQAYVVLGDAGEDRISILAHVTAALNTDLDNAATELSKTHDQLDEAYNKIARLEAQLAGREPPVRTNVVPCPAASPPRKRLRYGAPGSTTGLLG